MTGSDPNLRELAARGEYQLLEPLDYMILQHLPDQGTLFAGLYPLGETTPNLVGKFTPEQRTLGGVDSHFVSTRLRVLHIQGLVLNLRSAKNTGGKRIWQRTKEASRLVKEWEKNHHE